VRLVDPGGRHGRCGGGGGRVLPRSLAWRHRSRNSWKGGRSLTTSTIRSQDLESTSEHLRNPRQLARRFVVALRRGARRWPRRPGPRECHRVLGHCWPLRT
jgi:hypothetical protein